MVLIQNKKLLKRTFVKTNLLVSTKSSTHFPFTDCNIWHICSQGNRYSCHVNNKTVKIKSILYMYNLKYDRQNR